MRRARGILARRGAGARRLAGALAVIATSAVPGGPGTPATLPLRARIVSIADSGPTLMLTIACHGGAAGSVCAGTISARSHVTRRGGKLVAVAAGAATTLETVATGSYSVATGQRAPVALTLDGDGQTLLDRFYRVPATVAIAGTTPLVRVVRFAYPRVRSPISFTWTFARRYTVAELLTVTGIPPGGSVTAICHGGGCPFGSRTFAPSHGRVALVGALGHARLRPGARLEIEVTAAGRVGKIATFTFAAGREPLLVEKCLVPGAARPTRCA